MVIILNFLLDYPSPPIMPIGGLEPAYGGTSIFMPPASVIALFIALSSLFISERIASALTLAVLR